jgi:hypothetical protein
MIEQTIYLNAVRVKGWVRSCSVEDPGLPKIVGMLVWYDESPSWLAGCIGSLSGFVDHLIAVDGGYTFFPGAMDRPASRLIEAETIMHAADSAGIALTMHRPVNAWEENEVGKRSYALDLCYNVAREDDWIFIFDADEVVRFANPGLKRKLAETDCLVATYSLIDTLDAQAYHDRENKASPTTYETESRQPIRDLHRAVPGLHYEDAHYVLATSWPDGQKKYFRGMDSLHQPMVEAFDATDLLILEHRSRLRAPERNNRRNEYYRRRDSYGLEAFHRYEIEMTDGSKGVLDPSKRRLDA